MGRRRRDENEFYQWLARRLLPVARAFQSTAVLLDCDEGDLVQEVMSRIGDFFGQQGEGVDLWVLYSDPAFREGARRWSLRVLRNVYVDMCRRARVMGAPSRVCGRPSGSEGDLIDPLDGIADERQNPEERAYWTNVLEHLGRLRSRHRDRLVAALVEMEFTTPDEKFTMATLSAITGLSYKQLYRIAAEVRDRGTLDSNYGRDLDDEQV